MRALLIVDMLKDFIEDGAPLQVPRGKEIIPNIRKLLDRARERGIPVIYICDAHRPDDPEFKIWPKHAVRGTRGAEVVDELKPSERDYVIEKRRYSGFFGTDLDLVLRELGVEELIITGVLTDICVLHTAADASMRGYKVIVPEDAVATLNDDLQRFALDHIERVLQGRIVKTDDLLREL